MGELRSNLAVTDDTRPLMGAADMVDNWYATGQPTAGVMAGLRHKFAWNIRSSALSAQAGWSCSRQSRAE